ncbi:MAG TPA: LytTR family DNA-binding domain-containing protein, partial [Puia sp.]|nr:LytTR family DNA-binding domain-containing protein [Puia sp.]
AWDLFELKNKAATEVSAASAPSAPEYFFVNVDYSLVKINFGDIAWIEGLKDYVKIHLKTGNRPVVTRISMKSVEEQLPTTRFLRIHKSYIVAVEQITAIRKNSVFIKDLELPVGDSYRESVIGLTGKPS